MKKIFTFIFSLGALFLVSQDIYLLHNFHYHNAECLSCVISNWTRLVADCIYVICGFTLTAAGFSKKELPATLHKVLSWVFTVLSVPALLSYSGIIMDALGIQFFPAQN